MTFQERINELLLKAKELNIHVSACQEIVDNRIVTVPLYHDLEPKVESKEEAPTEEVKK
jgi:limonene-1,2-epoxide hydrolase